VDYNQQIEIMRQDTPEQVGRERVLRFSAAVDNVLFALRDIPDSPVIETLHHEINRNAGALALAEAEAIVAAEADRMAALEAQRPSDPVNMEIAQARADVAASNPAATGTDPFVGNPLIRG
jgi:hypothetical protein